MIIKSADQLSEIADCLVSAEDVQATITRLAQQINHELADAQQLLVLCLLKGGIVFTGQLLPRLTLPLELDYVHATRYTAENTAVAELTWVAHPRLPLAGRDILICDDIFDEGKTLAALSDYLFAQGAAHIYCAVLAEKTHPRKPPAFKPDFIGMALPDRYVFGMGMDYSGYWRNANGIYALKEA